MMDQFQRDYSLPDTGASDRYLKLDGLNPGLGVSNGYVALLEISPTSSHTYWVIGKRDGLS